MTLVERGVLKVTRALASPEDLLAVGRMIRRYRNVPMSLADACLVRIVERSDQASVLTLDSDFRIYRQGNRRVIPVLTSLVASSEIASTSTARAFCNASSA